MAFADGELDERVSATVEQAMASDPAIAKRVAEFLRSRRLIRSAFPEETAFDVPPELKAAVQAQIDRFEEHVHPQPHPEFRALPNAPFSTRWRRLGMALAASIASLALATAGYLAGRQSLQPPSPGPIAHLSTPEISHLLSEIQSGQEQELSFGRIRVISTFRMANGSLCREFKLNAPSGTSDAVACHANGWMITFAVASAATSGAYLPSGGADLMASYLQNAGAGEPLLDAAEIQALSETRPQR
ncbi:hypothetical protein DC522_21165 [Microvirga sp. KLBC 81]|uniref:anti-sigma factor family protein n=1 Tax=Microvirga sp. KLBC 81 TaxID=1862707 RepID=UPI000D5160DE|nr:hypothetical protein [Microvirga sp. KLBC 81]PVE22397.1 hypothetical protein DC522_21165 [Microvirga sp. KLBC 81]